MKKAVYILDSKRTPFGSFGGCLSSVSSTELGAAAVKKILHSAAVDPVWIEELIMGNVYSSNLGQAPARQVAVKAGLPNQVCCTTVNKVCASGMKSIALAAQSILLGERECVIAGGMENMSQVPYYLTKTRWGNKFGNFDIIDGLQKDGLQDAYDMSAMGVSSDATAAKYGFSRYDLDEFAIRSYKLAAEAWNLKTFQDEVIEFKLNPDSAKEQIIGVDEEFSKVNFDKIPSLKPAFTASGTTTAANASTINDGASVHIVASEEFVTRHNLKPLARIVSFADAEQEPKWFTTTPTIAGTIALKKAGLNFSDIDYFEVNEAFSSVVLAFMRILDIDISRMNVRGGAISIGHPLGASGARIVGALAYILRDRNARYGLSAICNGGGGASAMVLEKV